MNDYLIIFLVMLGIFTLLPIPKIMLIIDMIKLRNKFGGKAGSWCLFDDKYKQSNEITPKIKAQIYLNIFFISLLSYLLTIYTLILLELQEIIKIIIYFSLLIIYIVYRYKKIKKLLTKEKYNIFNSVFRRIIVLMFAVIIISLIVLIVLQKIVINNFYSQILLITILLLLVAINEYYWSKIFKNIL